MLHRPCCQWPQSQCTRPLFLSSNFVSVTENLQFLIAPLKGLYPLSHRASTLDLEHLPPGNHILVDTHSKVAGSPQPHSPECFHWERIKHLNRSQAAVCCLRTVLLPRCRMTDSRDKTVLLLVCCIVEMPKEVEREGKGSERGGTPYGNRNDERNPVALPESAPTQVHNRRGEKKQPQKNPTEPQPPPFSCVPLCIAKDQSRFI